MDHSWGYGTDKRQREENQDCLGVYEFRNYTLAIVCDGMGGHLGGAQASTLAVRTIHDAMVELEDEDLPMAESLAEALQTANVVIHEEARKNHRLMGMGTTAVVAVIQGDQLWVAHVGDSRAYLIPHQGEVQQLTRDHTMVNLFVDAELLSPEDAATHPEAHVLSRSLGVERQVEVDVSKPIQMKPGDAIFLCSDGVHGVTTPLELSNVDWKTPHQGVRHLLDIVDSRNGDDNATAVAVFLGTSIEDLGPTPLVEPKLLDDPSSNAKGKTAVPFSDTSDHSGSGLFTPDSGGSSYIVYQDAAPEENSHVIGGDIPQANLSPEPISLHDEPEPLHQPPASQEQLKAQEQSKKVEEKPPVLPPVHPDQASTSIARKVPASTNKRLMLLVSAAVLGVIVAAGVAGVALVRNRPVDEELTELQPLTPPEGQEQVDQVEPAPQPKQPEPPPVPATPVENDAQRTMVFAPNLPDSPRRLPQRPTQFTHPPPGGPLQWEAVNASRNKECSRALSATMRGMAASIDHATLYNQAWMCFNDVHQRPLSQARAENWEDFVFIEHHFSGPPEDRLHPKEKELKGLPSWYLPAINGIEYRLEQWMASNDKDQMIAVMFDLIGEPSTSDQFARDLLLEAEAAVGLASVSEQTPRVIQWRARRVYILSKAMNGRLGRLIDAHRPELIPILRDQLHKATSPTTLEDGTIIPVPEEVLRALRVGRGDEPAPKPGEATDGKGKAKAKPKVIHVAPPKEPSLEELKKGLEKSIIHR